MKRDFALFSCLVIGTACLTVGLLNGWDWLTFIGMCLAMIFLLTPSFFP